MAWTDEQLAALGWRELVVQLQACADLAQRTGGLRFVDSPAERLVLAAQHPRPCVPLLPPAGSSSEATPPGAALLTAAASLDHAGAALALARVCPQLDSWSDARGLGIVHVATQQGSAAVLEALVCGGCVGATAATRGGDSLLHVAAGGQAPGHLAIMRLLLHREPQLALAPGDQGYLPLHLAAEVGSPKAVELLLSACPEAARHAAFSDGRLPVRRQCMGSVCCPCPFPCCCDGCGMHSLCRCLPTC